MKIAFLGDIAFLGKFSTAECKPYEVYRRFDAIKKILNNYDMVVANLETPLTKSTKVCGGKSAYVKGDPKDAEILSYIGVTHVTLANNHIYDFREKGLKDTVEALDRFNIKYFGINGSSILNKTNDGEISLHGYCCYSTNGHGYAENKPTGVNILDFDKVIEDLEYDHQKKYMSILSIHWGQEHVNYPNYHHMQFARKLAESYQFILHGHHPHVIQGIEKINNSFIAYSMGNFCFDNVYTKKSPFPLIKLSSNNQTSFIWTLEIKNCKVIGSNYIPIYIDDNELRIINNYENFQQQFYQFCEFLKADKETYVSYRQNLLNSYLSYRKRGRDLTWYIKRLNFESAKILYNAHINNKLYNIHIVNKLPIAQLPALQNAVLILGNFDVIHKNSSGRRIVGIGKLLNEIGYIPVFIGVNKHANTKNILRTLEVKEGFYTYSLTTDPTWRSWIRVHSTYMKFMKVVNQIGKKNLKYVYIYGSPVLSILISKVNHFCRKNNIPVIGDCVDWIEHTNGNLIKNIIKYLDTNYQKRFLYTKMSGIVVVSRYLQRYYASKKCKTFLLPPIGEFKQNKVGIEKNKLLHFVYAGIPFQKIPNLKKEHMKDRLDKIIDIIIILNQRGIPSNIDIYGISKEYYLAVVPAHFNNLIDFNESIRFHGMSPIETVETAIVNADATILVRDDTLVTRAGFPTKVAESICLGTPVIANSTSDISDYIQNGFNGIIIENDPQGAAQEIIDNFVKDDKYKIMKENCQKDCAMDYKNFSSGMKAFLQDLSNK